MANQAVKITPHLKSEKQQSLEDIAIGDLIEINGRQERIYKIHPVGTNPINLIFHITLIARFHYAGDNNINPCIGYSTCNASIDMLKRGELNLTGLGGFLKNGRNPTIFVSKEANKREMETYKEYDEFLREYGDRD